MHINYDKHNVRTVKGLSDDKLHTFVDPNIFNRSVSSTTTTGYNMSYKNMRKIALSGEIFTNLSKVDPEILKLMGSILVLQMKASKAEGKEAKDINDEIIAAEEVVIATIKALDDMKEQLLHAREIIDSIMLAQELTNETKDEDFTGYGTGAKVNISSTRATTINVPYTAKF